MRKTYLLLSLFAGLAGCSQQSAGPPKITAHVTAGEIGSSLPSFSVQDLRGHPISSSALGGKVVLVDFWATWCRSCKKEMPGYQKLLEGYASRGFVVIGFKFDNMRDVEDPIHFAKRIGVHYPLAVATDDLMQKFGGIEGLPTTMLYDRQGVLRMKVIGFEYTNNIEQALKPLL